MYARKVGTQHAKNKNNIERNNKLYAVKLVNKI